MASNETNFFCCWPNIPGFKTRLTLKHVLQLRKIKSKAIFYYFLSMSSDRIYFDLYFFFHKQQKKDSIEYLSSSWTNIFKTGNDTDQESLQLFRQFHCADCLKSFQQQQQQQQADKISKSNTQPAARERTKETGAAAAVHNRLQMNTPPPPLQPIIDEAKNGLYHYFGQQNSQTSVAPLLLPPVFQSNQYVSMRLVQNSELKLMPNLTQIPATLQAAAVKKVHSIDSDTLINELTLNSPSPYSPYSHMQSDLVCNDQDDESKPSIQEKRQSINRLI